MSHRVGDPSTTAAVGYWLLKPSPLRNNERPSRETVEAYGHRVVHAEAIARARELRAEIIERMDGAHTPDYAEEVGFELAGFDRACRALGLGELER